MPEENKPLTEKEIRVIERLAHPVYTAEFIAEWKDRKDNVFANAPAALQAMGAHGFYEAVRKIAEADLIS